MTGNDRALFGTDGIRGRANVYPITAETALAVGKAAGAVFTRGDHRHRVVIGKDTRLSGYMLEPALTAGFIALGMDVTLVGPLPTPAIGILTRAMRADLGVMISASHNPHHDNGIKLFGPDGFKLSDAMQAEIESHVGNGSAVRLADARDLGRAQRLDDARGRYIEAVKAAFPKTQSLSGLTVVLDCANGAGYRVAPTVLWELGAEVVPLGVAPDGFNINRECGSTAPHSMARAVVEHRADLGIALDGDADRVVMCDETGTIINGDQLMAMVAAHLHAAGRLARGGLVATHMSNLGLERHLADLGIDLARTEVGDRYVIEHMRRHGYNFGGEQSGHLIFTDHATTGDGLIAALQVLAVLVSEGGPMSRAARRFAPLPQALHSAPCTPATLRCDPVVRAIADARASLAGGRLLVRMSGTEPKARVMAEGADAAVVAAAAARVVEEIARHAS